MMEGQNTDDEGFTEGDSPDDVPMENVPDTAEDEVLNDRSASVYYTVQNYTEGTNYSKQEVEQMMKIDSYQRKIDTCHLCGECWYDTKSTPGCRECEGFPMTRPCPICNGQCNEIWSRNVKLSHSYHEAHWEGTCKLPPELQQAFMYRKFIDPSEETLTESMQDLSTT